MSLINFVTIFTAFASMKHSCFPTGERARATLLLASSPWLARIPGFHPGDPGSIPGQGAKISLQDLAPHCLSGISRERVEVNGSKKEHSEMPFLTA